MAVALAASLLVPRVAAAGAAPAAGTLHLTWNDCASGATAASNLTSACNSEVGGQDLVIAFVLDQPVDSVIAIEVVIDVRFASPSVPAWWQLAPAGCRQGQLAPSSVPAPSGSCPAMWGRDLAPAFLYVTGEPWQGPSQARIVAAFALPGDAPVLRLEAGPMYFAARLALANLGTLPCAGCDQAACLVLNSLRLGRVPGLQESDPVLVTPGPGNANWATWQGTAANCASVPVRRRTWGQLKSLYR